MRNLWETMTRRWIPIISLETVSHQIRLCQQKLKQNFVFTFVVFFHFFGTSLISGHPVLCKNIRSRQNNPKFFFKIVSNQSRYLLIKHWQSDKLIQQLKISLLQMQRLVGDKMDACSHVFRVYWGTELLRKSAIVDLIQLSGTFLKVVADILSLDQKTCHWHQSRQQCDKKFTL